MVFQSEGGDRESEQSTMVKKKIKVPKSTISKHTLKSVSREIISENRYCRFALCLCTLLVFTIVVIEKWTANLEERRILAKPGEISFVVDSS